MDNSLRLKYEVLSAKKQHARPGSSETIAISCA